MEPEDYESVVVKTGWKLFYTRLSSNKNRWIAIHVATGRKYWPLITFSPNIELGINDPELVEIQKSLKYYTFPELKRFTDQLSLELSAIYQTDIKILPIR